MFQVLRHTFGYSGFHPNFCVWRRGWCTSTFSSDRMIATFPLTQFGLVVVLTLVPTLQWSTLVHLGNNRTGRSLQLVISFQPMYVLTFLRVNVNIIVIVHLFVICIRNQRTFRPKKSTPSGSKVWLFHPISNSLKSLWRIECKGMMMPNILLCVRKYEVTNMAWIFSWVLAGCCSSQAHWCHSWKWQSERGCAPPSGWRSLWVVGSEQ